MSSTNESFDPGVHLKNFIDRLALEQYLSREIFVKIPFLICFPLLLVLLTREYPTGTIFEIHQNLVDVLSLDRVESVTAASGIYSFLRDDFFSGLSTVDPLNSQYVTLNSAGDALEKKANFQLSTALLGWPVLHKVQGVNTTTDCYNSESFASEYQAYFPRYYYCGLGLGTLPNGATCPDVEAELTGNLVACADKDAVNEAPAEITDVSATLSLKDRVYGTIKTSVVSVPTLDVITKLEDEIYIDAFTSRLALRAVFYTPALDVFSFLEVSFEMTEVQRITGDYRLNTFVDPGKDGVWVSLAIVTVVFACLQLLVDGWEFFLAIRPKKDAEGEALAVSGRGMREEESGWGASLFHVICGLFLVVLLVLKLIAAFPSSAAGSGFDFRTSVKAWLDVASTSEDYVGNLDELWHLFSFATSMRVFGVAVILLESLRLVLFLACHPRVAMLVETVRIGGDDICHFTVIFLIMFSLLAFIARWVFGDQLEFFSSFGGSLYMQFQMLVGSWPFEYFDKFDEPIAMQVYVLLFGIVVFFMILNFFLSIIIDSYESTKMEIEEFKVEDSLFNDMRALLSEAVLKRVNKWPSRAVFVEALLDYKNNGEAPTSINFKHLAEHLPAELDKEAARNMYDYYAGKFGQAEEDFLHPLFGKNSRKSIKVQMTAAIVDIGDLVRAIAQELETCVTGLNFREGEDPVSTRAAAILDENQRLVSENLRLESEKRDLELKLQAEGKIEETSADPMQRKLGQVEEIVKLLNQQRQLIERASNGNAPPIYQKPVDSAADASRRSAPSVPSAITLSSERPKRIFPVVSGLDATLNEPGYDALLASIERGAADFYDLSVFAQRLLETERLTSSDVELMYEWCKNTQGGLTYATFKAELFSLFGKRN